MKINKQKWVGALAFVGAVGIGVGIAATTPVTPSGKASADGKAEVADLLAARSPGMRTAAALSSKQPIVHQAVFTPTYAPSAAGERTPATKVASLAPVPIAPSVTPIAPAVLGPPPVPATAVAVAGAPVAALPIGPVAAGGSSLAGLAALLPVVPAALAIGGGGGGSGSIGMAPAVPEPATWLMMISGFGVLGFALRRRRRQLRQTSFGLHPAGHHALATSRTR